MPAEFMPDIPADWVDALETVAPTITEKMADTAVAGEDWITNLTRLGSALVMTVQQRQILNVQMDRAREGLPPLDMAQYSPQVNIGLSADTKSMLMWGGAGLLLLTFLMSQSGRH